MTNLVANNDFNSPALGNYPGYGAIPSWTSSNTSRTGCNNRSGPFWNNATGSSDANGAATVGFLQSVGPTTTLTQTLSGLVPGQPHTLTYYVNSRQSFDVPTLAVSVGGSQLRSDNLAAGAWIALTATFTPSTTSADLVFASSTTGSDATALVTEVSVPQVQAPTPPPPATGSSSATMAFFAAEIEVYQPASGSTVFSLPLGTKPLSALSMLAQTLESSDTLLASDRGYVTLANDAGGVRVYPPWLEQSFEIDRHLALEPGGASSATFGTLRLTNLGRKFDAYALTRNTDSRAVRLYRGKKTSDPSRGIFVDPSYGSLLPFFSGTAATWQVGEETLDIPLRDGTYWATRPLQSSFYSGGGGYGGGVDLTGKPIPITRGGTASAPVLNVPLVLIDSVNLIYQYTDGPGSVVTLYEGGAAVHIADGDTGNLYAGTPPASGHYRTDNSRGLVQLGSKPYANRALTVDCTGAFPGAGAISTAALIARYVLTETMAQPLSMVDTAGFAAVDAAYPWPAGFSTGTAPVQGLDIVQLLAQSIGAHVISARSSAITLKPLRAVPAGANPAATLSPLNVVAVTPSALPNTLDPPPYRWRVGYQRLWQTQTSDLNGGITTDRTTRLAAEFLYATWAGTSVLSTYRRPNNPDPVPTALTGLTEAQALANALGALWQGLPSLYAVEMPVDVAASLDIGSVVLVTWPLRDLAAGKLGQVVGEQVRSADATTILQVLA